MQIFVTNIYGYGKNSIEKVAQNMVTDLAIRCFGARELGIYAYDMNTDSQAMLNARLDGILAAVTSEDVVFIQSPVWNSTFFEKALMERIRLIAPGAKMVVFVHDMPPLMWESERYLIPNYLELYNKADVIIFPTENALRFWREQGLTVEKVLIQHMWDHPVEVDTRIRPTFSRTICFAGNPEKFTFVKEWKSREVQLAVTAAENSWTCEGNVKKLGWFQNDALLAHTLRSTGGFGLHWTQDPYWMEYMKYNASYKLSLYLASGLPVIVPKEHPEKDYILRKNIGITVSSLEDAVAQIMRMTPETYAEMVQAVEQVGKILRDGGMIKKLFSDALFKLYFE